jgi:hypothetical protein
VSVRQFLEGRQRQQGVPPAADHGEGRGGGIGMASLKPATVPRLDPEKVAYWYFRLNGFFQIENFVVHPARRGGQRTDADLLTVRFPHRAERLFDDPNDIRD